MERPDGYAGIAVRERWLGATGRKVPEVIVEGELQLPDTVLLLDGVSDITSLQEAFGAGRPIAIRADNADAVRQALARPEVSCVVVPADRRDLLELDLRTLTYG
jgi:hypothetical protein